MFQLLDGLDRFLITANLDVGTLVNEAQTGTGSAAFGNVEEKTKAIGTSGYRIVFMVMVFIFLCGLAVAFIKLFLTNGQQRNESKTDIIWKVLAIIGGFGAVALLLFLAGVGKNLFG